MSGTILAMRCACADLYRLDGAEAREYATEHLVQTGATDFESWTVAYECPDTSRVWLQDYPHSEYHGGGSPRLRQLDSSGAPIVGQGVDPFA